MTFQVVGQEYVFNVSKDQEQNQVEKKELVIVRRPDIGARYQGGAMQLQEDLVKSFVIPQTVKKPGRFYMKFKVLVGADSSVSDIQVIENTSRSESVALASVRAIELMNDKFIAAIHQEKNVASYVYFGGNFSFTPKRSKN